MNSEILENLGTNPTQLLGLAAFASATIACIFAKRNSPNEARAWIALATANAAFFIEILIGTRLQLHGFAVSLLLSVGLYANRTDLQYGLLLASAAVPLLAALLLLFFSRLRKPRLIVATFASFSVLTLFAIETISLHRIDEIFYQETGPVLLIGWLWCVACLATILSALL
jgi:hypothetical protein